MGLKEGAVRGGVRNVSTGVYAIPDSGVSRWVLDGDATDEWGDNDGVVNGASFVSDAEKGTVAEFARSNSEYINVGSVGALTEWTFVFQAKIDTDSGEQSIISNDIPGYNDDVLMGVDPESFDGDNVPNNTLAVTHQDDNQSVRTSATDNQTATTGLWLYLLASSDGSTLEFGRNGSIIDSTVVQGADLTLSANDVWFGSDPNTNTDRSYGGRLFDIRLYSKQLSSTEFSDYVNTGSING